MDILKQHGIGNNSVPLVDRESLIENYNAGTPILSSKLGYKIVAGTPLTVDYTTPIHAVNVSKAPYGTARPQVLSNGWIVIATAALALGTQCIYFYISKDNGATWSLLCSNSSYFSAGGTTPFFAMVSYGTTIYAIVHAWAATFNCIIKFDVTKIIPGNPIGYNIIDSNQSGGFGSGCSLAVSSTGVLTAVWCSKNSSWPDTFNLRSAKSVDGGMTWTRQDGTTASGIDQITLNNAATAYDTVNPYILYDKTNKPVIIAQYYPGSTSAGSIIVNFTWDGSAWTRHTIYNTGLIQLVPNATLQKYGPNSGRIWTTWYGYNGVDSGVYNIQVSYSDDNGVTWSTPQKITSGADVSKDAPSITSDMSGNIYVLFYGEVGTNTYNNIRQLKYDGNSWGSIIEVTSQSTDHLMSPATCDNFHDFTEPITIWRNNQLTIVGLYGAFTNAPSVETINYSSVTLKQAIEVINSSGRLGQYGNKKWKSGSVSTDSTSTFTVTDLTFKPSLVFWHCIDNGLNLQTWGVIQNIDTDTGANLAIVTLNSGTLHAAARNLSTTIINDNGFTLYYSHAGWSISTGTVIYWKAIE